MRLLLFTAVSLCALAAQAEEAAPLVVLHVSQDVLNKEVGGAFQRKTSVEEIILDTPVVGTSITHGDTRIVAVEGLGDGALKIEIAGTCRSDTLGDHPPVKITSHSITHFQASRTIRLQDGVGFVAEPLQITGKTETTTDQVTTRRDGVIGNIIKRRAWKIVEQTRGEVNAIAHERALKRLEKEINAEVEVHLAKWNTTLFTRRLLASLLPANVKPTYCCRTHAGCMQIAVYPPSTDVRNAAFTLPKLNVTEQPIQVWIHHNAVGKELAFVVKNVDTYRGFLSYTAPAALLFKTPPPKTDSSWTTVQDWIVLQSQGGLEAVKEVEKQVAPVQNAAAPARSNEAEIVSR